MGGPAQASPTRDEIDRAVRGDRRAVRTLVRMLTPVIQARVARTLLRHRPLGPARDVHQEVEDLCQHVLLALFSDDGKALRAWDPERGLPFRAFVGMLSEREVSSVLRSQRRNPWTDDPTEDEHLEAPCEERAGPEQTAASREQLRAVLARLRETLSDRGMQMFYWLYVDGRSVAEICELGGLNADAVYAWRSRLGKQARAVAAEVMSDSRDRRRRDKESTT